jgi:cell wall-associated NlpC family hydrolase
VANPITLAAAAAGITVVGLVGLTVGITTGTAQADSSEFRTIGSVDALKAGTPYAQWINAAAKACPGLPAPLLAAQLQQESGFNPDAQSPAGAQGIAQFVPGTWQTWKVDANQNGVTSPLEPADAITAQGRFMCQLLHNAKSSGYPGNPLGLALAGYNAGWNAVAKYRGIPPFAETKHYVSVILAGEKQFTATPTPGGTVALPSGFTLPAGTPPAVRTAVAWALKQKGGWYQYGGTCTQPLGTNPQHWCDCSSLVQKAYAAAGISLARTTFQQVKEGQAVSLDAPAPGDLVFAIGRGDGGSAEFPGHVGMYIGSGYLIEAPHTGAQIRTVTFSSWATSSDPTVQVVAIRRIVTRGG